MVAPLLFRSNVTRVGRGTFCWLGELEVELSTPRLIQGDRMIDDRSAVTPVVERVIDARSSVRVAVFGVTDPWILSVLTRRSNVTHGSGGSHW